MFSVRQFSSNAQQSQDKRDNNLQDSRPSFGNTYVNNFIREEELANSQRKQAQANDLSLREGTAGGQSPAIQQQEVQGVTMFGDMSGVNDTSTPNHHLHMTPNESSIKQDLDQNESSLSLHRMGLHESADHTPTTYQSLPHATQKPESGVAAAEIAAHPIRAPLTTKHGQ